MTKVTLESLDKMMRFMLEHMATKEDLVAVRSEMATKKDLEKFATKDDLNHSVGVLERKIDRSEINLKAAMNKRRLELETCIKDEVNGLANIMGAYAQNTEHRLTDLERRAASAG